MMTNMASLSLVFFFIPLLFSPACVFAKANLESFYNIIISQQNQSNIQNAKYAPFQEKNLDISQLNKKIHSKQVNIEMIAQLLPIVINKQKYYRGGKGGGNDTLDGIDLHLLNLTVFHTYEELKPGNKLPLFFSNEGPIESKLLKKPLLANASATSCGSALSGEMYKCVASLEDMLKFVNKTIGKFVKPILTPAGRWQQYTVVGESRKISDNKVCVCHKSNLRPFAIYGCHFIENSIVRLVPLVGEDGTRLTAVNVCHMKTSSWGSNFFVFQLINAKPGIPVCHFLATDDIIWIAK